MADRFEFNGPARPQRLELATPSSPKTEVPAAIGPKGSAGPAGPVGDASALVDAAIEDHVTNPRPHPAAESGRDFAGWYIAGIQ